MIPVYREGQVDLVPLLGLHNITGAPYIPALDFVDFHTLRKILQTTRALKKKEGLEREREWLAVYFQKEILANKLPEVSLRWINNDIGWGVFAERDFQQMEYITEYSGKVRRKRKNDAKNAYCFEYPLTPHQKSSFVIDAMDQGGISRYINHDFKPNLRATMVNVAGANHIILYTITKISKNTQLCYNYGSDYWRRRKNPVSWA